MILLQSTLLGLQNVNAQRGSDNLNALLAMKAYETLKALRFAASRR
jgi:hypothetical protein